MSNTKLRMLMDNQCSSSRFRELYRRLNLAVGAALALAKRVKAVQNEEVVTFCSDISYEFILLDDAISAVIDVQKFLATQDDVCNHQHASATAATLTNLDAMRALVENAFHMRVDGKSVNHPGPALAGLVGNVAKELKQITRRVEFEESQAALTGVSGNTSAVAAIEPPGHGNPQRRTPARWCADVYDVARRHPEATNTELAAHLGVGRTVLQRTFKKHPAVRQAWVEATAMHRPSGQPAIHRKSDRTSAMKHVTEQ